MVKKTISQLTDGKDTETSAAEIPFSQGGATFRGPSRPNPVNQINVRNQAQLVDELGANLEIPNDTNVTIVVDASFTLTESIKVGNNSGLELVFSNVGPVISWTGTGAMIENIDPGVDDSAFLVLDDVNVSGDGTNSFVDITIASAGFTTMDGINLDTLASIGTLDSSVIALNSLSAFGVTQGLVLVNVSQITVRNIIVGNFSATNTTWLSILTNGPSLVTLSDLSASNSVADGDRLVFFDPNAAAGTSFSIRASGITDTADEGEFYQLGTDIAINSVADNGSGDARFTTAAPHGLEVGTPVVLSGFVTETTYNGTFIVTAIPTTTTFDVAVAFNATDTGNMNTSSLDSTDPIVFADANRGSPNSNTISESSINGTLEVDGSGGVDVPIVDITPVAGDWIEDSATERFSVDTTTGLVTYNGIISITAMIKYSLTADAATGPAQTIVFDLHINGGSQTKTSFTVITPVSLVYNGGNFVINPGDTFQLFKDNTTNTNNTNVSVTTLLINED